MNRKNINTDTTQELLIDIVDFLKEVETKLYFYSLSLSDYSENIASKDKEDLHLEGLLWASGDYGFEVVMKSREFIKRSQELKEK